MASGGRAALGRLPGEPKKPLAATGSLQLAAGTVLTKLQVAHVRQLLGKSVWPSFLDLSPPCYNLEDDLFLTNCPNVVKGLDLSGNSMMELTSLSHLSKLKLLYADRNVISSVTFRGLLELELLSLKQNRMENLNDMGDLRKLVNLDLSHNRLSAGFEELSKLRSLRVLDLSQNRIDMPLAEFHAFVALPLKRIPKLEYLSFEGNPIEHSVPEFRLYIINELPKLRYYNWAPVTKDDKARATNQEQQKTWKARNDPVGRTPAQTSKPAKSETQQRRLSTTLDDLLQEITVMTEGEGDATAVPVQDIKDDEAIPPPAAGGDAPTSPTASASVIVENAVKRFSATTTDAENQIDRFLEMFDEPLLPGQPAPAVTTAIAPPSVPAPGAAEAKSPRGEQGEQKQTDESALVDMLQDLMDTARKDKQAAAKLTAPAQKYGGLHQTGAPENEEELDPLTELEQLLGRGLEADRSLDTSFTKLPEPEKEAEKPPKPSIPLPEEAPAVVDIPPPFQTVESKFLDKSKGAKGWSTAKPTVSAVVSSQQPVEKPAQPQAQPVEKPKGQADKPLSDKKEVSFGVRVLPASVEKLPEKEKPHHEKPQAAPDKHQPATDKPLEKKEVSFGVKVLPEKSSEKEGSFGLKPISPKPSKDSPLSSPSQSRKDVLRPMGLPEPPKDTLPKPAAHTAKPASSVPPKEPVKPAAVLESQKDQPKASAPVLQEAPKDHSKPLSETPKDRPSQEPKTAALPFDKTKVAPELAALSQHFSRVPGMRTSVAIKVSAPTGLFDAAPIASSPVPMDLSAAVRATEQQQQPQPQQPAEAKPEYTPVPYEPPLKIETPPWVIERTDIRLQKRLGDGALGTTYTATPINGREVIVKKIRPQRFSTPFLVEFNAETSRVFALAQHDNIVQVIGGSTDSLVCFVTQYVMGVDLLAFVQKLKKLEALKLRLSIARGIVSGLLHLHRNGIVHGSLKPTDVILNIDGVPKLRDYGFCKLKGANLSEGANFAPEYLPLEMFTKTPTYSEATDIFCLGVTLWVLFEGPLGRDVQKLPAPQEGRPFVPKFTTGATPTAIATLITRCCALEAPSRPTCEDIATALAGPDPELMAVEAIQTTSEERQKMRAVDERLTELLETPSDVAPVKALAAISTTIAKSEPNVCALVEDGVLARLVRCLVSSYDVVIEQTLRTLVVLAAHEVVTKEYGKQKDAWENLVACMANPNDSIAMLSLRVISGLIKDKENRQMVTRCGVDSLIQAMQSQNDFILTSAVLVAARLVKQNSVHEEFYNKGGLSILLSLLEKGNPGMTLHVISALSSLLFYEPAQDLIVSCGIINRLAVMLVNKSDLQQITALKCVCTFASCEGFLRFVQQMEWIDTVSRLLSLSSNDKIHIRAFRVLSFLAIDEEPCLRIESHGVVKLAITAMANKLDNEKLSISALRLLDKLLVYEPCRESFRSAGGLPSLSDLFRKNASHTVIQRACIDLFVRLSDDQNLLDAIADTGIAASISSQLVAARHRGDATLVQPLLRVVCQISRTRDSHVAKQILRAGGMDKLIDILTDAQSDAETVRMSSSALLSFASSGEDFVQALSNAGGFEHIFSLISKAQFAESTMREIIPCIPTTGFPEAMSKHGAFMRLATRITSDAPVIQSLALKTVLLVAQSWEECIEPLWEAGVPAQLKQAAAAAPNRVVAGACAKALELFAN